MPLTATYLQATLFASALLLSAATVRAEPPASTSACPYASRTFTSIGVLTRLTGTSFGERGASAAGALFSTLASGTGMRTGPCVLGTSHRFDLGLGVGAGTNKAELETEFDVGWGPRLRLYSTAQSSHAAVLRVGTRLRASANGAFGYGSASLPQAELGYQAFAGPWLVDLTARVGLLLQGGYYSDEREASDGLDSRLRLDRRQPTSWGLRGAIGWDHLLLQGVYERVTGVKHETGYDWNTWEGRVCSALRRFRICSVARVHDLAALPADMELLSTGAVDHRRRLQGWSTGLMLGYGPGVD